MNEFVQRAYKEIRNDLATEIFGKPLADLTHSERQIIYQAIPMNVSELAPIGLPPMRRKAYNRKRSSFLNSFRAPAGSQINPDYQAVTNFTNRFTHLNSKKCKKVKIFTK